MPNLTFLGELLELTAIGAPLEGDFSPPAATVELLRRCAVIDRFDREIFEELLLPGLPEDKSKSIVPFDRIRSFEELIAHPEIEPVAQCAGQYRLGNSFAHECLNQWSPEKRGAFCQSILQWFDRHEMSSPADEVRLLPYRLEADPATAKEMLLRHFEEAEDAFDLAQCDQLIRILEGTPRWLDFHQLLQDLHARYQAKSLFADEFLQTVSYQDRDSMRKKFADFLNQDTKYILQLHGPGGFGKTTGLREWIARTLVPTRVPVARIDFDFIDCRTLLAHPWLILCPIAEQLNLQLAGRPLETYWQSLQGFSVLLKPAATIPAETDVDQVLDLMEAQDSSMGSGFAQQFARRLDGLDQTILVLLDTTEEPLLHGQVGLSGLLQFFQTLHTACSRLKIVLSGRYDIFGPERPSIEPQIVAAVDTLEIKRFSDEEAGHFLTSVRRLERGRHLVDKIVKASGGSPFKLALYAELALSRQGLSMEDLEQGTADFAHLMRRVIERIPKEQMALRWLIRYGAIPRQLTREYALNVTLRVMEQEIQSPAQDSRSTQDLPRGARHYVSQKHWNDATAADIDALWQSLRRYASAQGWISYDTATDTFTLQPDVVRPMRELVAKENVWGELQRASRDYFWERAQSATGKLWVDSMVEAVFHALQFGGVEESRMIWKAALAENAARDAGLRQQFAMGVFHLADLIDGELKNEAQFQGCLAAAALAALEPAARQRVRHWRTGHFEPYYFRHRARHPESEQLLLHIGYWSGVEYGEKRALEETRLLLAHDPASRGTLANCVAASLLEEVEPERARNLWLEALETSQGPYVPWRGAILRRLAAWDAARDRLVEAETGYEKLRQVLPSCPNPAIRPGLYREIAMFYRSIGRPYEALAVLKEGRGVDDPAPISNSILEILLHLDLGDEESANRRIVVTAFERASASPLSDTEQAAWAEAQGAVEALGLRFEQAHSRFDQAINRYSAAGQSSEAAACILRQARLCIDEEGNLATAQRLMQKEPILTLDRQSHLELYIEAKLVELRLDCMLRRKPRREIETAFLELKHSAAAQNGIRLQAHIQATCLALGFCQPAELVAKLEPIKPGSARLPALRVLQFAPGRPTRRKSLYRWRELFKDVFAEEPIEQGHPYRLKAADFLRRAGLRQQAREMLEQFFVSDQPKVPALRRQMLLAFDLLGVSAKRFSGEAPAENTSLGMAMLIEEDLRAWRARRPMPREEVARHRSALEGVGLGFSRFAALAMELLAKYDAEERNFEDAKANYERSTEILQGLGQYRRTGSIPKWLQPEGQGAEGFGTMMLEATTWLPDIRVELTFNSRRQAARVGYYRREKRQKYSTIPIFDLGEGKHLASQTTQLLETWESDQHILVEWADRVLRYFSGKRILGGESRRALALGIDIFGAFPWENLQIRRPDAKVRDEWNRIPLTLPKSDPDSRVKWMQGQLNAYGESLAVDGFYGSLTDAALRRFGAARESSSPPLATLRRQDPNWKSSEVLLLASRRHQTTYGVEPWAFAEGLAMDAREEVLDPHTLLTLLRNTQPVLIHLSATFVQGSLGNVTISTESGPLSAEALGDALRTAYAGNPAPVVFLNVPEAKSHENRRQILFRNLFATELFATSSAGAIFAYGMEMPHPENMAYRKFGEFVAGGPALGKLRQEWRRLCSDNPLAESVLWSFQPTVPVI